MNNSDLIQETGSKWFRELGSHEDVVISSKLRLSRNISGFRFPPYMDSREIEAVRELVVNAFKQISQDKRFVFVSLEDLDPLYRLLLSERRVFDQNYALHCGKEFILEIASSITSTINYKDHLRLNIHKSGFELKELFQEVRRLDAEIASIVDYSVSMEYGYIGSKLDNFGTGMKATVLLHLPCLAGQNRSEAVTRLIDPKCNKLENFVNTEQRESGNFFVLSSNDPFGNSELDILSKLARCTEWLIINERNARSELIANRSWELEDRVSKAMGVIKNCKLLSYEEGVEILSSLRVGAVMGWIDIPLQTLNTLLIKSQDAHMQDYCREMNDTEETTISLSRAKLFMEYLLDTPGRSI